jgi:hypothetical protein
MIQVWNRDAKAIEVDPQKMPITAAVAEFLEINKWKDKININDKKSRTTLEYTMKSRGTKYKMFIEAQEEYERISVYAYTTFEVPPARMGEMARLINIINMVQHFGRFGCADDDESNAVQFCLTYDVEGGSITGKQIDLMADEAMRWYDRWYSLLASVALTKTTAKEAWATHLEDVAATEAMPDLVIRNGTIQEEVDKCSGAQS